jgi:hypothetical protein
METINTKAFDELTNAEQNEIDGGTLIEDIGYGAHAWCDFWGKRGEDLYDFLH